MLLDDVDNNNGNRYDDSDWEGVLFNTIWIKCLTKQIA